jgi:hypothetical protein
MTDCRFRVFDQGFDDVPPAVTGGLLYRPVRSDAWTGSVASQDTRFPVSSW